MADYAQRLRSAGLRVTRPRSAVLHAVHTNPHSDTETIIRAVRDCLPYASRQAVYDILHALTRVGLLRRVQPSGSVGRYETRVGDNHHHVVCRSCGVIADVDCAVGQEHCLTASDVNGFQLDEAEVIYWGRCPDCAAPDVSQVDGDHSPIMKELRDEMLCSSGTSLKSPRNDRPISTPTPSPEEWLAPALPTPITVFQAARIGSGGLGANVGWARHDVADATFTVPGRQNELSLRAGSTWIVVPQIKMPAKPGPCLT
jgi:Fe2+ or Zn2+ uptake regulation protein